MLLELRHAHEDVGVFIGMVQIEGRKDSARGQMHSANMFFALAGELVFFEFDRARSA